jgi:hypothetical protein
LGEFTKKFYKKLFTIAELILALLATIHLNGMKDNGGKFLVFSHVRGDYVAH